MNSSFGMTDSAMLLLSFHKKRFQERLHDEISSNDSADSNAGVVTADVSVAATPTTIISVPAVAKSSESPSADIATSDGQLFNNVKTPLPEPKQIITMRLDRDLLTWLRQQGPGYQTRINHLLRQYMEMARSA